MGATIRVFFSAYIWCRFAQNSKAFSLLKRAFHTMALLCQHLFCALFVQCEMICILTSRTALPSVCACCPLTQRAVGALEKMWNVIS